MSSISHLLTEVSGITYVANGIMTCHILFNVVEFLNE